jgi:acetyl-CoA carboxylase biotin carboxyl carrier protein
VSLTGAEVAEILRLLEDSSFDELDLEMNGVKLTLRRGGAGGAARAVPVAQAPAATAPATAAPAAAAAAIVSTTPAAGDEVAAPLLGTFYRAPRPGAPPFVEVGSLVQEDTVIAIIEVMKLMNTVRAGMRGRVSAILVADGTLVEYGQALLRIERG